MALNTQVCAWDSLSKGTYSPWSAVHPGIFRYMLVYFIKKKKMLRVSH